MDAVFEIKNEKGVVEVKVPLPKDMLEQLAMKAKEKVVITPWTGKPELKRISA